MYLQDALAKYPAPVVFFNSDQGNQYTELQHIALLKNHHIMISMNGKGNIDNIVIEIFFRNLKYNCIFANDFTDIKDLKKGIKNYVAKYNYHRFHSSIGYKKPMNIYLDDLQKVA